jgi:hypothetical protein
MDHKQLETWAWVLIYGGLLLGFLGLFMARAGQDSMFAMGLAALGGLLVAGGVAMIVLRARRNTRPTQHAGGGPAGQHRRHKKSRGDRHG